MDAKNKASESMTAKTGDPCSICGRGREEWEGEGITIGSQTYCQEQCARITQTGQKDQRGPERAIIEAEKVDAYDGNDMQPAFDEAPVNAGGSRSQISTYDIEFNGAVDGKSIQGQGGDRYRRRFWDRTGFV